MGEYTRTFEILGVLTRIIPQIQAYVKFHLEKQSSGLAKVRILW